MPIAQGDIDFFFTGGATNSDPNASLGGTVSNVQLTDNTLHNLFDVVSGTESSAGDTEYRCIVVWNSHGTLTLQNAVLWISSETSHSGANIRVALDLAGLNATPDTIANENTAPDPALTFVEAASQGAGLSLGNIPAGQYYAFWIERIINSSTAAKDDYTTVFSVLGETSE